MEFQLRKIGHVVLNVSDLDASTRFYEEMLGLRLTDRYPDGMVPGGMLILASSLQFLGSRITVSLSWGAARKP